MNRKLLRPSHYSQHRKIGYGSFKVRKAHNFGQRLKKPFKLRLTFQCSSKTKIFSRALELAENVKKVLQIQNHTLNCYQGQ